MDIETERQMVALKEWLQENNLEFCQVQRAEDAREPDLHIRGYDINVRIERGNGYDQKFYTAYRHRHPVFVRKGDTPDFLTEKVQGAIIDQMQRRQRAWARAQNNNKKNKDESKD